jgi:hypothetical protein
MKVVSPLETIQEGITLGHFNQGSLVTPSHLNTPRREGTTPSSASPKYFRHLCGSGANGLLMSQNLMYGMRSPVDVRSRTSLHSRGSARDDVTDPDVVSHQQV